MKAIRCLHISFNGVQNFFDSKILFLQQQLQLMILNFKVMGLLLQTISLTDKYIRILS